MIGTVTKIVEAKGFGFIRSPGQSKDVFFHMSELDASLPFDATLLERRVCFEVEQTDRGPKARDIRAEE